MKVTGVTVSGIAAACKTTTVEFVDGAGAVVSTVTGPVASGATTMATTIWTKDFNDVRVTVSP